MEQGYYWVAFKSNPNHWMVARLGMMADRFNILGFQYEKEYLIIDPERIKSPNERDS